jgi:hypothetical protein
MVSALRKSFPQGAHSQTTLSHLHGVLSKAGAVKARGFVESTSSFTAWGQGDVGGEDESDDNERCLC